MSKGRLPENVARIEQIKAHLRTVKVASVKAIADALADRHFSITCPTLTAQKYRQKGYDYRCHVDYWSNSTTHFNLVHDDRTGKDHWDAKLRPADIQHLVAALHRDSLVTEGAYNVARGGTQWIWVGEPDEAVIEHQLEAMWEMEAVDHD